MTIRLQGEAATTTHMILHESSRQATLLRAACAWLSGEGGETQRSSSLPVTVYAPGLFEKEILLLSLSIPAALTPRYYIVEKLEGDLDLDNWHGHAYNLLP